MDAKTFFSKVVLMRKAQKDYFKCRTQQNLRKCKALETEIDGEIERVNSITGVSSVSKEPRQTNLFTDQIIQYELNCIKRNHGIPFRAQILCQHCSNKRNNKARNLFLHFCNKRSRQSASTGNRNNSVIPVCRNSFFPFTPDIFRFVCKKLNHNNL